jgi:hypothetical protein
MRAQIANAKRGRTALRWSVLLAIALVVALPPASGAAQGSAVASRGIWISAGELRRLPRSGPAWEELRRIAERRLGRTDLSNMNDDDDINTLAAALVYARTGDGELRRKAARGVMAAIGTERGGRTLALGRGLLAYVVAADLVDLQRLDPAGDATFRAWLRDVRFERLKPSSRPTLAATHEAAPNNWGTHAGASRIAADVYLGDTADLARAAAVFKGYLGDRGAYHGFRYGSDLSWAADPARPVGVVPAGASREGRPIGGALPDDMRRGCSLRFPPCPTGYPWEAMQGAAVQAELLSRQGYDAWNWGDRALERAARFLMGLATRYGSPAWRPVGNDVWVAWLLNRRYGMRLPVTTPTAPGRGMGFTDWTHGRAARCPRPSCASPRGTRRRVVAVPGGPLGLAARRARAASAEGSGVLGVTRVAAVAALGALGPLVIIALVLRHAVRR